MWMTCDMTSSVSSCLIPGHGCDKSWPAGRRDRTGWASICRGNAAILPAQSGRGGMGRRWRPGSRFWRCCREQQLSDAAGKVLPPSPPPPSPPPLSLPALLPASPAGIFAGEGSQVDLWMHKITYSQHVTCSADQRGCTSQKDHFIPLVWEKPGSLKTVLQ